MNFKDQLIKRLDKNLSDYHSHLLGFERQEIIDMASKIGMVGDVHKYLTQQCELSASEVEYLLQFQNPLKAIADQGGQHTYELSDIEVVIKGFLGKQSDPHDYPLMYDLAKPDFPKGLHKFVNVDVIATLEPIMKLHTELYQSDFEIDKGIFRKASSSENAEDRVKLWMTRPNGTFTLSERNVFIKGSGENSTWANFKNDALGYVVEIFGMKDGKVMGNVYELDFPAHEEYVRKVALPATSVIIGYADGHEELVSCKVFDSDRTRLMCNSGHVNSVQLCPDDSSVLDSLLKRERQRRELIPKGRFKTHLNELHSREIQGEVNRIVSEFKNLSEPNSPNKTHYMVKISERFIHQIKDIDLIYEALPFKTKTFSGLNDEKGYYAFIKSAESRDISVTTAEFKKPSIRDTLQKNSQEIKVHSSPDKTKSLSDKGAL